MDEASGFVLTMEHNLTDEFWCDVSLLGGANAAKAGFDFDWLFGTPPSEAGTEAAVTPTALGKLVEAQARLIAVSQPLPVVDVK